MMRLSSSRRAQRRGPLGPAGLAAMGVLVLMTFAPMARAEDSSATSPMLVNKTVNGITFRLPPDWPVEKRAGTTAPIPIEEYLARKFKALEERLGLLEQRLQGFDIRLRLLERGGVGSGGGLRSSGQANP